MTNQVEFFKGDKGYIEKLNDVASQATGLDAATADVVRIRDQMLDLIGKQERLALGDVSEKFADLDAAVLAAITARSDAFIHQRNAENAATEAENARLNLEDYLAQGQNAATDAAAASEAAQTARVGIETIRDEVEVFSLATEDSASNSAASASSALSSKNAAADSASNAAASASSALSSKNTAQSARDGALEAKDEASSSASLAATRTATAATYRDQARTYRDEALEAKDEASSSASLAATRTATAATYRDEARTYRDQAEGFRDQAQDIVNGEAYLPRTGGTLSGTLRIENAVPTLHLEETDFEGSYFQIHKNGNNTFYYSSSANGAGDGVHIFSGRAFNTPGRVLVRETDGLKEVLHAGNYASFINPEDVGALPSVNAGKTVAAWNNDNTLKLWSNSGTLEIGARNGAWCHFITNRAAFYFDKKIAAIEQVGVYGRDSYIGRTEGKINGSSIHHDGNNDRPFVRIYGDVTLQPFDRVFTSTLDVYQVTIPSSPAGSTFAVSNGNPSAPIHVSMEKVCRAAGKVVTPDDIIIVRPGETLRVLALDPTIFTLH